MNFLVEILAPVPGATNVAPFPVVYASAPTTGYYLAALQAKTMRYRGGTDFIARVVV